MEQPLDHAVGATENALTELESDEPHLGLVHAWLEIAVAWVAMAEADALIHPPTTEPNITLVQPPTGA